jgi:hypothetical protein
LPDLVAGEEAHLHVNGPWPYKLSEIDDDPSVTAVAENIAADARAKAAA